MISTMLRGVGLEDKIELLEMDPDGFDTLTFPGPTFRGPKGWDRYRERLLAAFPDEETVIHRCLDVFQGQAPDAMHWAMRPLSELFDDCGLSQRPRAVIGGESGACGSSPSRAPVIVQAGLIGHYLKGAYYPKGGPRGWRPHGGVDLATAKLTMST